MRMYQEYTRQTAPIQHKRTHQINYLQTVTMTKWPYDTATKTYMDIRFRLLYIMKDGHEQESINSVIYLILVIQTRQFF